MSRLDFDNLVNAIQGDPVFEAKAPTGRKPIEYRTQLGIFLYWCGDPGSGVCIAAHFGVLEGSVFLCINRVILTLLRLWKTYVK